jgi:membrane-bound lytic murein transglycosylase A
VGALKTPLYALPADIVQVRLRRFGANLPPLTLTGRVRDNELIPYYSRQEIQGGGALGKNESPIAYVNEVDLFFLQIQGSGTLRFRDGRRIKIGYAASNGHPYRSIGALLVRRGEMELEEVTLQSIRAYLAANPIRARQVLFANPSYVFFQIREDGPLGNIRVPLTPGRSLALDRHIFPKGGLAYVTTMVSAPFSSGEFRPLSRFMLVQDTGGAIRGHGRGDLFFGAGKEAEWQAGNQKHGGRLLLLVAKKDYLNRPVPAPTVPTR